MLLVLISASLGVLFIYAMGYYIFTLIQFIIFIATLTIEYVKSSNPVKVTVKSDLIKEVNL